MGKYLDIARRVSEERTELPETIPPGGSRAVSAISAISQQRRRLLAAGWVPMERAGKTIWASPRTGFWYSEEMARELSRLDEEPPGGNKL